MNQLFIRIQITFVVLAGFFLGQTGYTQESLHHETTPLKDKKAIVVFYNVENLFDTIDDPHKNDNAFLPDAKKGWDSEKYQEKLQHLAEVLGSIHPDNLPAIIGFSEVENKQVLEDLMQTDPLNGTPYQIILEEGDDPRGIDVALAFRSDHYAAIGHQCLPGSRKFKTRHILYVKLLGPDADTLHLFVNHWKSRYGGAKETEYKRVETASILRSVVDSLFLQDPKTRMIIMGDFNDEPADSSMSAVLKASPVIKRINAKTMQGLYNLHFAPYLEGKGTLWYKDWDLFDQIVVSGILLTKKQRNRPFIRDKRGEILLDDRWLTEDHHGNKVPFRSYRRAYTGGYSDHLPVFIVLQY
jgi:hypothetical protein